MATAISAQDLNSDLLSGWIDASANTWTFGSSTTFTISGIDLTTTFTPGTRLKLTQTTVKYFIVVSSSFSTNTTVTVTGGSDYSVANAAISANYYSYAVNPQGYPGWFNWSPTLAGFSANPAGNNLYRFSVVGRACFMHIAQSSDGTSNSGTFTFTLPITAASQTGANWTGFGQMHDNGATPTTLGQGIVSSGGTTIALFKDSPGNNFTASGGKRCIGLEVWYEI